jgi:hypothetical protein
MDVARLYEKRVGGIRLEIGGLQDDYGGAIYYESADGRFRKGGFDVVLDAVAAVLQELRRREGLARVLLGPFEPLVPHGSERLEEARAAVAELQARLEGRERAELGPVHRLSGVWLGVDEALALLGELGPRLGALSAEESMLRLVLLGPGEAWPGWDLLHENGVTQLGRWNENLRERPGPVPDEDVGKLEAALEAAREVLELRLGQAE